MGRDAFWQYVYLWESDFGEQWEPWEGDNDWRRRGTQAASLLATDPAQALEQMESLSDEGYVWAMRYVGHICSIEGAAEKDSQKAWAHLDRAVNGGSWMATLELAKLINREKLGDDWEPLLEDGVDAGFVPSMYWLAWYRYQRDPGRKSAWAVRPLLEQAVAAGHQGARMTLAQGMATGKFGWREIRAGFRLVGETLDDFAVMHSSETVERSGPVSSDENLPVVGNAI